MNRYVVEGLLADLKAGKRILTYGRLATEEWELLAVAAEEDGAQVRMASGQWRASYPSKNVELRHFRTVDGMRGYSADIIVIFNRQRNLDVNEREAFNTVLAGSPCPEVIWL